MSRSFSDVVSARPPSPHHITLRALEIMAFLTVK